MTQKIPRITVRVLTYNQEKLIGRTIESILSQKEYIYEICIVDDCSTDHNWQIIQNYATKYPDLIRTFRNDSNLGVYQNVERAWGLPTGDINYDTAGDDEIGQDWFKRVVEFIQNNDIDYKNELFCIYGDHKRIYPNGDSFIFRNSAIKSGYNPLKLYERGMISNRSSCYSTKLLKKFIRVSQGRAVYVENAMDAQLHFFAEKAYYLPYVGNIYYTQIGISIGMSSVELDEYENTMLYAFSLFKILKIKIDKCDESLPEYNIAVKRFKRNPRIASFVKVLQCYINCYDPEIGLRDIPLKHFMFLIIRKLPHSFPICW